MPIKKFYNMETVLGDSRTKPFFTSKTPEKLKGKVLQYGSHPVMNGLDGLQEKCLIGYMDLIIFMK